MHTKAYMECMQSTMHVMYPNNFACMLCSALLLQKTSAVFTNLIICSFARSRNHLLYDKFICLSSYTNHTGGYEVCNAPKKYKIIDLFKMWICIENVNNLFNGPFTKKSNCKWPEAEKTAIRSKCEIQFSSPTNTWSATFFQLSIIEFFISQPVKFSIEEERWFDLVRLSVYSFDLQFLNYYTTIGTKTTLTRLVLIVSLWRWVPFTLSTRRFDDCVLDWRFDNNVLVDSSSVLSFVFS